MWQDIIWEFLALGDPRRGAGQLPGEHRLTRRRRARARAHTFHWIRNLAALGTVDTTVTANHPLAAVFIKNGARTYVASNITAAPITVTLLRRHHARPCRPGRRPPPGAFTWSGGNADRRRPGPDAEPHPDSHPAPSPTPTPPPTHPAAVRLADAVPAQPAAASGTAGGAATTTVAAANGNHDGTPTNAQVFTATGLNLTYAGGQTAFDLFLDAGTAVGNGVQVRVSYDLTGNGSWDRVETYRYFATDPVTGYEHYTQAAGLASSSGTLGTLTGGTVKVEVWSAIGNNPTTLGLGNQSVVRLPYS